MEKTLLLLLDPAPHRREAFREELSTAFEVVTCRSSKAAREILARGRVVAIVASMYQGKRHGLDLCSRLARCPGGDVVVIVHGRPTEGDIASLRERLETEWPEVDNWLPSDVHPAMVRLAVVSAIEAQSSSVERPRQAGIEDRAPRGRLEVRSAANPDADTEEIEGEPSWGDLMNADLSVRTLKALAKKDLLKRK